MLTDMMFGSCHAETVRQHARHGDTPVYNYVFTYRDRHSYSYSDRYIGEAVTRGLSSNLFRTGEKCSISVQQFFSATSHGDELMYLFKYTGDFPQHTHRSLFGSHTNILQGKSKTDPIMSLKLTWMWANFAHTG